MCTKGIRSRVPINPESTLIRFDQHSMVCLQKLVDSEPTVN